MEAFLDFCLGCVFYGLGIRFGLIPPFVYRIYTNIREVLVLVPAPRSRTGTGACRTDYVHSGRSRTGVCTGSTDYVHSGTRRR